jgi:hypothetical protein
MREQVLKECPLGMQQKQILWAELRKETGRGKSRFKIRDSFADERCP